MIIAETLAREPPGGWLGPSDAVDLLGAAGIPAAAAELVGTAEAAVACWRRLGGPVVLKAHVPGVLHKSRAGGVLTNLASAQQVSQAVRAFRDRFGADLQGVVVQPMVGPGPELLVGVVGDLRCGPLLTVGLGGTLTTLWTIGALPAAGLGCRPR